jgi:hypothetical protein
MKTSKFSLQIKAVIVVLLTACLPLHAGVEVPHILGGGEPGLKIVYQTTNQLAIYLDEPWTVGANGLMGGYDERHIDVLMDHNYGLKEKIRTRTWGDNSEQLYPFDENTAFTCEGGSWAPDYKTWKYWPRRNQVFSLNGDGIVVSNDIYAMARSHYGLTSNQLFLGKIRTNVYYWETQDPRKVFYRNSTGDKARNYFKLPKGTIDVFGVTKGVKEKENIGITTFEESRGFFHYAPYEIGFIEVSFKAAKTVKGF